MTHSSLVNKVYMIFLIFSTDSALLAVHKIMSDSLILLSFSIAEDNDFVCVVIEIKNYS